MSTIKMEILPSRRRCTTCAQAESGWSMVFVEKQQPAAVNKALAAPGIEAPATKVDGLENWEVIYQAELILEGILEVALFGIDTITLVHSLDLIQSSF